MVTTPLVSDEPAPAGEEPGPAGEPAWWGRRRPQPGLSGEPGRADQHAWELRAGRVAGRVVLYGALGAVFLAGLRSLFSGGGSDAGSVRPVTAAATSVTAGFPAEAAGAFAARFTRAYLTWPEGGVDPYRAALAPFLPEGTEPSFGWDGTGHQTVEAVIPAGVEPHGPQRATVTIAAALDDSRWVHLAVPVAAKDGALVVAAPPAFVPAPPVLTALPAGEASATDEKVTETTREPLGRFFAAYATGDTQTLGYLTTPAADIAGLAGAVTFAALDTVTVEAGREAERTAHVRVRWTLPAGGNTQQAYRVDLRRRDGRWYVAALGAERTGPSRLETQPSTAAAPAATRETK